MIRTADRSCSGHFFYRINTEVSFMERDVFISDNAH